MLVFIPLSRDDLGQWARSGAFAPAQAFAVTDSMMAAFGFTAATDEQAENTALDIAGLAAGLSSGIRLVAVAEAQWPPLADDFGRVQPGELPYSKVSALFFDPSVPAVTAATVDEAWDEPAAAEHLAKSDLAWYHPAEWEQLTADN
ncbi:MAG: hypothetical protein LBR58_04090 [Propionibacteriaceae bacterium]|nr:hypothetical protein [Propionibacteriaceae bacterium]